MRPFPRIVVMAAAIAATAIFGCAPFLKFPKLGPTQEQTSPQQPEPGAQTPSKPPVPLPDRSRPPTPGAPSGRRELGRPAPPALPAETAEREQINQSALQFAKGIPDVQHVKTCYSKVFGGWYLHLYVKKGKKISKQHYTWNPATKEWDVSLVVREVPLTNVEQDLKTQVEDEKCSILK